MFKVAKFYYSLKVAFKNDSNTLLYSGKSFYNKSNSVDMTITENEIHIAFSRSKKFSKEDLFDTPSSQIRYHLQKALCFYLATVGSIPEVESMTFNTLDKVGENVTASEEVSHKEFSSGWHKCKAEVTIPCEIGNMIFRNGEGYKRFYISLTYFLKSQLSKFSDDGLGWVWSSFNALYTYLYSYENQTDKEDRISEQAKINYFFEKRKTLKLKESVAYIKTLDKEIFWKNIGWYVYTENMHLERFDNYYRDEIILSNIIKYANIHGERKTPQSKTAYNRIKKCLEHHEICYKERVLFLICDYCYMLRNRIFHAGKSYPLFVISEKYETLFNNEIRKVMLLLLKDVYEELLFDNQKNE